MKRISKELSKSYFTLILIFLFSYIMLFWVLLSYINKSSSSDIRTLNSFLTYETSEFEKKLKLGKTLDFLFKDALAECPEILGTNVYFIYDGKVYEKKPGLDDLNNINLNSNLDKINTKGYFNYQYFIREIKVPGHNIIKMVILKNMKDDRKLIINLIIISIIIGLSTLAVSIFISNRFYKEFEKSLKILRQMTNKINLDTLGKRVETKNKFIEFELIMNSYNNMLKRLQKQTESQIDFVNNASHELKTPIFIISGYINMVKRWGINNKEITKEAFQAIGEEVKSMSTLINKLLFLAKGDEVKAIDNSEVDIKKIFSEIVDELKIIYPNQVITLKVPEVSVFSDFFLLKQLFLNLVENAIKYGNGKEVKVEGYYENGVKILIIDKGQGISEENLQYVYEKFFRVDKGRSRENGSHGLGLSIVKKITETLKIDINIESKLGEGTTVILNIPIEPNS